MKIRILDGSDTVWEMRYQEFVVENAINTAYPSFEWRDILIDNKIGRDLYILCVEDKKIICALPAFITNFHDGGNVINSLPTIRGFGGYGGPVVSEWAIMQDENKVISALEMIFNYIDEVAEFNRCISFTFSIPPLADKNLRELYLDVIKNSFEWTYKKEGFAQITLLDKVDEKNFSERTRRAIKKGLQSGISIIEATSSALILQEAYEFYSRRMKELGVAPKPFGFFEGINRNLFSNRLAKFFAAIYRDKHIGGLITVGSEESGSMVDYFVPYYDSQYKNLQPTSVAIDYAIKFYRKKGLKFWNWQSSSEKHNAVYDFKAGWGAIEVPYYYFTKIYCPEDKIHEIWSSNKERYAWYYVAPFEQFLEFKGIYR